MDYFKESLKLHEKLKGKIEIKSKAKLKNKDDLSLAYTPGVAQPCREIAKNPDDIYKYTSKGNMVAIVTDGSAVLGLGNIGASAALPVMEGKAVLFKEFGNVDAFPIVIESQDNEEIIKIVKNIAHGFGGINIEDIAGPRCFEIEERLKKELDIPVFHDDQHGTAVVVLAGLLNSVRVVKKELKDIKVVISGAGAAGIAIARLLLKKGVKDIILLDSKGAIYLGREEGMNPFKDEIAESTNLGREKGLLSEIIMGKDVFIGVSKGGLMKPEDVGNMNKDAIIFAMANPDPEIMPDEAKQAGAVVVATGRSDFANQINNVLGFPNIFRGALDARATDINDEMILAAAQALADSVDSPRADKIIPDPFETEYRQKMAKAVYAAAVRSGVARCKKF